MQIATALAHRLENCMSTVLLVSSTSGAHPLQHALAGLALLLARMVLPALEPTRSDAAPHQSLMRMASIAAAAKLVLGQKRLTPKQLRKLRGKKVVSVAVKKAGQ